MTNHRFLSLVVIMTIGVGGLYVRAAQNPAQAEAKKAIRKTLYEHSVATLTGDAETAWGHMAQRMKQFYQVLFEAITEIAAIKQGLSEGDVKSGKEYFLFSTRLAPSQQRLSKDKVEELAREHAASPITFVSNQAANIQGKGGPFRVVLENGVWKIDATESLKKGFLQVLPLPHAAREKLEKY